MSTWEITIQANSEITKIRVKADAVVKIDRNTLAIIKGEQLSGVIRDSTLMEFDGQIINIREKK